MEIGSALVSKHGEHWVIGVSGGPDSMALLALADSAGLICHVIHVNYHKRETANRDQTIVETYCKQRSIDCQVVHAPDHTSGNFQAWARNFRYQKMIERCHEVKANGIMCAHHQDDDLETYKLQTRRQSKVEWYGLKSEIILKGTRLNRPLLNVWKTQLETYCQDNSIPYGVDESNFSSDYLRNRVRKELLTLSPQQKSDLLSEKASRNEHRSSYLNQFGKTLDLNELDFDAFLATIEKWPDFLFEWLRLRAQTHNLSASFMGELKRQLVETESILLRLNPKLRLIKQYGSIRLIENPVNYCYTIASPINLSTPFFECSIEPKDRYEKLVMAEEEYPLTIRNVSGDQRYQTDSGERKLSRWFISHKIPLEDRETWPVVYNAQNELIFIPRCKVKHDAIYANKSLYMLK